MFLVTVKARGNGCLAACYGSVLRARGLSPRRWPSGLSGDVQGQRCDRPFDFINCPFPEPFQPGRASLQIHRPTTEEGWRPAGVDHPRYWEWHHGEFIRKVLNVFDEHQSRENTKHVHVHAIRAEHSRCAE